jgi:hypothetical protein
MVASSASNKVGDQFQATTVSSPEEFVELLQRAEARLDVLVVADVVAAVVPRRRGDRREPDDIDAQVGQVVEPADVPPRSPTPSPFESAKRAG